ncbi:MAG: carboxypeptidase-like regulatory domain-containing protein [Bacteroidia bacterium]
MIKKILLLCCVAILTTSCGIDYDGSTRNLFKGTVVDGNALPVEGVPVAIVMHNNSFSEKVAFTYTDAKGNFRLTAPRGKNGIPKVIINQENGSGLGEVPEISSVTYHNINQDALPDYTLDLGTVALASPINGVRLKVNFSYTAVKKLNVLGIVSNNSIDMDFPLYVSQGTGNNSDYPYAAYYNDLTDTFYVNKNQTLTLRYMDANEDIHDLPVTIGTQDVTINLPE